MPRREEPRSFCDFCLRRGDAVLCSRLNSILLHEYRIIYILRCLLLAVLMDIVRTIKALGDPLRLRVLAAVAQEELTVGEVQEVVASVQSSVSRNLAILREAGFVQDRKEGTNVYFTVRQNMPEPAGELFKSLQARLTELPEAKQDRARLEICRRRRLHRSQSYFESVAGDWERICKSYFDDRVTSLAIE